MPGGVTGNFVGETLFTIRAHQGDLRLDWNASAERQALRAASRSRPTRTERDQQPFPLVFATRNDQPFYNVGVNWTRVFGPSLINEVLVGYSNTTVIVRDLRLGRHRRRPTPLYGIAGGQPIDGLSSDRLGAAASPLPGAIATDSDTLAKTYQINEKLTWLKGRHAFKFGGQFLRYDQRRFYAGNNGLLGFINLQRRLHRLRVLGLPARPGVGQGPGGRRSQRPLDPPPEPDRRSSSRTTSRSRRTSP